MDNKRGPATAMATYYTVAFLGNCHERSTSILISIHVMEKYCVPVALAIIQ